MGSQLNAPQDLALVEFGAFTGWALAAADFNSDGVDNVAIAALGKRVDGTAGAGAVNIPYGIHNSVSARRRSFTRTAIGFATPAGSATGSAQR